MPPFISIPYAKYSMKKIPQILEALGVILPAFSAFLSFKHKKIKVLGPKT